LTAFRLLSFALSREIFDILSSSLLEILLLGYFLKESAISILVIYFGAWRNENSQLLSLFLDFLLSSFENEKTSFFWPPGWSTWSGGVTGVNDIGC
jgi:hypothetical protein